MEQRAKERELERLERRGDSAERDKENRIFVARRNIRPSPQSKRQEYGSHPEMSSAGGSGGGDIYQRTTEYVRRKEGR